MVAFSGISFSTLYLIKDNKEFLRAARFLEKQIVKQQNSFLTYKLAVELDERGFSTKRLQKHIITLADPRFILKLALDVRRSDPTPLQEVLLKLNCAPLWAHFACLVPGADIKRIENQIIQSNNARAAYICLRYLKHPNINKLKTILINSAKPRYLYALSKKLQRKKDIEIIQEMIINSGNPIYQRLFAVNVKMADILKLEDAIISSGNSEEIKKFAFQVGTERAKRLSLLA